jgi:hypothetical protein
VVAHNPNHERATTARRNEVISNPCHWQGFSAVSKMTS